MCRLSVPFIGQCVMLNVTPQVAISQVAHSDKAEDLLAVPECFNLKVGLHIGKDCNVISALKLLPHINKMQMTSQHAKTVLTHTLGF